MSFTSFTYIYFFVTVFVFYWGLRSKGLQNIFLLGASYLFYGFVHPWFCILIALSTLSDYLCALGIEKNPLKKKSFLVLSLLLNLGFLGLFKYFNFFVENTQFFLGSLGVQSSLTTLEVLLPVGISFYTFQTLSYTIDVYRGSMRACSSFVDFSLYVSFFSTARSRAN